MPHHAAPSQRQLRVSEQLRHVIVEVLQRGHFSNIILLDAAPNVTVSEVRVSPDLKHATAYAMTLGGIHLEEIIEALNESAPYFQKEINRKLRLKFTPKLHFVTDESFEEAEKIEKILHELHAGKDL